MVSWEKFKEGKIKNFEKAVEQGEADEEILDLANAINKKEEYATSSSCAGRILLLEGTEKGEAKHYKKWHRLPKIEEIKKAIDEYRGRKTLWLRVEPFILHVFCKNMEAAMEFMKKAKKTGVKRGGIQYSRNFYFIEIQGTIGLNMPANLCTCEWKKLYRIIEDMMEENKKRRGILKKEMAKK